MTTQQPTAQNVLGKKGWNYKEITSCSRCKCTCKSYRKHGFCILDFNTSPPGSYTYGHIAGIEHCADIETAEWCNQEAKFFEEQTQ